MAKFKWLAVVMALMMFLMSGLVVSAQGEWNSGINIQNLGEEEAQVQVLFYDADTGALVYTYPAEGETVTIPVGEGINVYVPGITDMTAGRYSAVVLADQPVGAVVNSQNRPMLIGDSYLGTGTPSATLSAPLVFRNYNGYNSVLYIQNASDSPQDIKIELFQAGSSTATATTTFTDVPVNASLEVNLGSVGDFAAFNGKYGAAKITGLQDGPLAAVISYERDMGTGTAAMTNGEYHGIDPDLAAKTWYAPVVYKNHNGWATGINILNTESVTTTVTVTYTASAQSAYAGTVVTDSLVLGPNAMGSFYMPSNSDLPASGFYGGALITSDVADILIIVNSTNYSASGGAVAAGYEAISASEATSKISAPLIFRGHADTNSGINVQNVGTQATTITLTVAKNPSSTPTGTGVPGPWTFTHTNVPAGGAVTFYLPASDLLGGVSRLYGSAVIQSSNDQPLVAVITSASYPRGISANYVGINYGQVD